MVHRRLRRSRRLFCSRVLFPPVNKMRLLSVALLSMLPTVAVAQTRVEAGLSLGGHVFSSDSELGIADDSTQPSPSSSLLLSARFGLAFNERFAAEVEAGVVPTKTEPSGDGATVVGFRGQARLNLLTGSIRPFLVAGYGGLAIRTSAPMTVDDTDPAYHYGAGVSIALSRALDLRFDARHMIVPDRTASGATNDFEVSAGAVWRFGRGAGARATPSEPAIAIPSQPSPPVPKEGDGDGDGLDDRRDKCADQAEDPDGFQDDDGCPDLDNDSDGIVDAADQCPDEAETKNNHLDDDGCPDQLVADLVGFTFPRNSDKFDPAAAALLERTYQVLDRNSRINVEIAGHSSEGESKPLELSIARAEAVKEYLVRRGISEDRMRTVGYGSERPVATNTTRAGRDKNRRVEFRIIRPDE
jgi:OmpA-OmpF porin, OOP family